MIDDVPVSHPVQLAKAYGHLPGVGLKNLGDSRSVSMASEVVGVLTDRCCGTPDRYDDEVANATPAKIAKALSFSVEGAKNLISTHQSMNAATGRGSFPPGCHTDVYPHDDRHCVLYYTDWDSWTSNYSRKLEKSELDHLMNTGIWRWSAEEAWELFKELNTVQCAAKLCEEAYRLVNVKLIETSDHDKANIHCTCKPIGGSTIGLGWFNSGTCGSHVECRLDSGWRASLYRITLLLAHEMGHNNNLQHEFSNQGRHRSVMSYSWPGNFYGFWKGGNPVGLPEDASRPELRTFYGNGILPIEDSDTPPPTDLIRLSGTLRAEPFPGGIAIRGKVTAPAGLKQDAELIAYPHPTKPGEYVLQEQPPI